MARGKLPIFERYDDGRLMGYQVKIRKRGFPAVSKQFDKLADAERWAVQTLDKMNRRTFTDLREAERTTLGEALERYRREVTPGKKSAYGEGRLIERFQQTSLAQFSLATIQGSDIAAYRDARLGAGAAANTVRIELALLSHLFTVAAKDWGMALPNPVKAARKPALPNGRDRRLSPDLKTVIENGVKLRLNEEQRLLRACDASKSEWLAAIVRIALETGMRRGEILSMDWRRVKLSRKGPESSATWGTVHLPATKNGESRTVPLSSAAVAVLEQLPYCGIDGRVFPIGDTGFTHTFQRACEAAGITGLTFHDLRHEAISRLFERGDISTMEAAAISGHKSMQMLKRYTHLRADDLAKKLG